MARGSVVDEPALIEALKNRTIYSAGLDVFAKEPQVPKELMEMEHVVLFPHLGSSTEVTRAAMDQLVVDNILAWAAGKPPLTPVPETPYPPKRDQLACDAMARMRCIVSLLARRFAARRRAGADAPSLGDPAKAHARHLGVLQRRPRQDLHR